ncbi:MAG TPA: divalent-cation tolerance protein CutA [Stellaceae bacterium]|nr:divalent-cation tolerance protein CutA [Stellaceae bacterium]
MAVMFVYATAGNADEALRIGRAVVEARLAACANVLSGMRSVYWWEGRVQESEEAVLVLKTSEALLEPLVQRVKSLHSYACPCIEALPVIGGHQPFLDWVVQETKGSPAGETDGLLDGG